MNIRKQTQLLILVLCCASFCYGQAYFPDIEGYKTLICDFHTHTVFSDGKVWPTVRIDEAQRENIDAVAITDHIEYLPHKKDIPPNHNRPYELVEEMAKQKNILAIKGAEITRGTPPGHYNAVFIDDVEPLDTKEFLTAIKAANKLEGFVFWNHHSWQGLQRGNWEEVQTVMYENKWLKGIEVANGGSYYPDAHQWCLDKNMTMLGNSDIHDPSIDYIYTAEKHRTLTLVFSNDKSLESINEALLAGRTAVWYKNQIIGREEILKPLFFSCVKINPPHYIDARGKVYFEIENNALVDIQLSAIDNTKPAKITIPARSKVIVSMKPENEEAETIILKYQVNNFLITPDTGLPVEFTVSK